MINEWKIGQIDGRKDGRTDGRMDRKLYFITVVLSKLQSILVFTKAVLITVQIIECNEFLFEGQSLTIITILKTQYDLKSMETSRNVSSFLKISKERSRFKFSGSAFQILASVKAKLFL